MLPAKLSIGVRDVLLLLILFNYWRRPAQDRVSPRTTMSAPNSTERKVCWNSRDQLWKCLDDHGDKAECCQKYQKEFEASCPAQWVNYPVPSIHTKACQAILCLIVASAFPPRWSILPRGETSSNTKRRWRQKALHLLKGPNSLPSMTADHLDFLKVTDHSVHRTVKNSSPELAIIVIYWFSLQMKQILEEMKIYMTSCLLWTCFWLQSEIIRKCTEIRKRNCENRKFPLLQLL